MIRDLYAAEVTYVDHWIGRLLEPIDKMGLGDDTVVVFTTMTGRTWLNRAACRSGRRC